MIKIKYEKRDKGGYYALARGLEFSYLFTVDYKHTAGVLEWVAKDSRTHTYATAPTCDKAVTKLFSIVQLR